MWEMGWKSAANIGKSLHQTCISSWRRQSAPPYAQCESFPLLMMMKSPRMLRCLNVCKWAAWTGGQNLVLLSTWQITREEEGQIVRAAIWTEACAQPQETVSANLHRREFLPYTIKQQFHALSLCVSGNECGWCIQKDEVFNKKGIDLNYNWLI